MNSGEVLSNIRSTIHAMIIIIIPFVDANFHHIISARAGWPTLALSLSERSERERAQSRRGIY